MTVTQSRVVSVYCWDVCLITEMNESRIVIWSLIITY